MVTSILRSFWFVPAKRPYIFLWENPVRVSTQLIRPTAIHTEIPTCIILLHLCDHSSSMLTFPLSIFHTLIPISIFSNYICTLEALLNKSCLQKCSCDVSVKTSLNSTSFSGSLILHSIPDMRCDPPLGSVLTRFYWIRLLKVNKRFRRSVTSKTNETNFEVIKKNRAHLFLRHKVCKLQSPLTFQSISVLF